MLRRFELFAGMAHAYLKEDYDGAPPRTMGEYMSQELYDALKLARLTADPRNGGDWDKAKEILEAAGWTVYLT